MQSIFNTVYTINMQFKFSDEPLEKVVADLVVVLAWQRVKDKKDKGTAALQKSDGGMALDKYLGGLLSKIIKEEVFRGETATRKLIYTDGKTTARAVLVVGLGKEADFNPNVLRKVGAKITEAANEVKARSIAGIIQPESLKKFAPQARIQALVEGFLLGSYKFEQYKKEPEPDTFNEVVFIAKSGKDKIEGAIKRGSIIADGVILTRNLVNIPARDLTPDIFAKKAREIATKQKLGCTILNPKQIADEKMGLFLAVARGSENEPRFVHLSYKPAGKVSCKIALVGKGITFDSGGYDLKPVRHMLTMKCDMAGAATSLAVIKIVSEFKLPIALDVYIPLTDNMIDAKAEVPGNIIKSRNGKTVEIISIDAEGRLVLADAISYALERKPDVLIDVATLTGGVLYALGEIYTAALGNDQKLINKYLAAAKGEDEPAWQLPLAKEYKKGFTEGPADLRNMGKTKADTIAGALFLEEFVGEDVKWLHLDTAETAWANEERNFTPVGGTGTTVRTLVRLFSSF